MDNQFDKLTTEEKIFVNSEVEKNKKSPLIAWLLWWFLGTLGGHRYYFGKTGSAVAMTLITVLSFGLGLIVTVIWALVDAFQIMGWLKTDQDAVEQAAIQRVAAHKVNNGQATPAVPAASMTDELKKLKELLDSEAITEEEYEAKKKDFLGM